MLINFFALKWPALLVLVPCSLVPYSLYFVPTAPTP